MRSGSVWSRCAGSEDIGGARKIAQERGATLQSREGVAHVHAAVDAARRSKGHPRRGVEQPIEGEAPRRGAGDQYKRSMQ